MPKAIVERGNLGTCRERVRALVARYGAASILQDLRTVSLERIDMLREENLYLDAAATEFMCEELAKPIEYALRIQN